MAVRRAEQKRAESLVGRFGVADGEHEVVRLFRILQITIGGEVFAAETADVVEGVVTDAEYDSQTYEASEATYKCRHQQGLYGDTKIRFSKVQD